MQSKKKQRKGSKAVYRAIPPKAPAAAAAAAAQEQPAQAQDLQPGELGQAAVTAAALHQLNQYAADIEAFVRAAKMRTLVNRIQSEIAPPTMAEQTYMRLRRK